MWFWLFYLLLKRKTFSIITILHINQPFHYHINQSPPEKHIIPMTQMIFISWTASFCFCFFSRCYSSYVKELKTSLTVSKLQSILFPLLHSAPGTYPCVTKQLMRDFLKYILSHTSAITSFFPPPMARQNKLADSSSFRPNLIFIHSVKEDAFFSPPIKFNKSPLKSSCYDYITNSGFIQWIKQLIRFLPF